MTHLDEWQPLSIRYGHDDPADETWADKRPWGQRHRLASPDVNPCACPGYGYSSCAMRATQEDFLCDECREWCVALDSEGNYHQLASLPVG